MEFRWLCKIYVKEKYKNVKYKDKKYMEGFKVLYKHYSLHYMGMKTMVNVSMLDQGVPLYTCLAHPKKIYSYFWELSNKIAAPCVFHRRC